MQHHGAVMRVSNFEKMLISIVVAIGLLAGCSTNEIVSGTDPATGDTIIADDRLADASSSGTAPDDEPGDTLAGGSDPAIVEPIATEPATTDPTTTVAPPIVPLSGWAAVDQYLEVTIVRGGSSAVAVAVLRNGELQHEAAYGRRVADDPVEPTDRFRVASISKTILAAAALTLVDDGTLTLDEAVGGQLASGLDVSAPTGGTESITLRHLLTHRSGFAQYEDLFFRNEVDSCADAARVGFAGTLQSVPGTDFQYSNMNFCVIGLLIEQVTGTPYEQVVQDQVLDPLGITTMRTAGTFELEPGDVEHASEEGRNYMEVLGGAGAWLASPVDLVTFLDALDPATPGTKILESATLELMTTITETPPTPVDESLTTPGQDESASTLAPTTTVEPPPPTNGYGMGLIIFEQPLDTDLAAATYGHTGTLESTHAMMVRRPDGLTWAITVSGDYPSSTPELSTIMDNALFLGGFADGSYTTPPPPLGSE